MAGKFNERLQGLLQDPTFNLGVGLLGAGAPSTQQRGFGGNLAQATQFAGQQQQQLATNNLLQQRAAQNQQQQQAQQQLAGLLQGSGLPQGEMLGLLAQTGAGGQNAVAQALTAQSRQPPAAVRIAQFLNSDAPEEEKAAVRLQIKGDTAVRDQIDLLLLQANAREEENAATDRERSEARGKASVINTNGRLRRMAELNSFLVGTVGETGLGADDFRAAAAGPITGLISFFGGDEATARSVAAALQEFDTLTTDQAIRGLFEGQLNVGTPTDSKLNAFVQTKPGVGRLPEVNARLIAKMIEENLQSGVILGAEITDLEDMNALIEKLRSDEPFGATVGERFTQAGADAADAVSNAAGSVVDAGQDAISSASEFLGPRLEAAGGMGQEFVTNTLAPGAQQAGQRAQQFGQQAQQQAQQFGQQALGAGQDAAQQIGAGASGLATRTAVRVAEVKRMSQDQLAELVNNPAWQGTSEKAKALREAARKRWEELTGDK